MTKQDNEHDAAEADGAGLYWVGVFLVDLAYGGPEEGGWWYQTGILVVDPKLYEELGGGPAGFVGHAEAAAYREHLDANVAILNAGRPAIEASNSVGVYEVRLARAQVVPTHFPDHRPHYE